jgi:ketosteroid isomerase-like protein
VSERNSIEQQRADYVEAFNREDIPAMMRCAAPDIDAMAPGRPAIRGMDDQVQFWRDGFKAAKSLLFLFPDDLEVMGDVAIDRHRWVLDSMPKRGGRPVHDEGKGVWIWRRHDDGSWRIARSIWNSDFARSALLLSSGAELSEDLAGINKLLDDFVATVNAGDPHGWGELMIEDFIFAVPGAPQFVGKATAVAAAKAGFFEPFDLRLASRYEDIQIFGESAFTHSLFVLSRTPKSGGATVTVPGKCTSFLRKQGKSWKHALIIFSYDQPTG